MALFSFSVPFLKYNGCICYTVNNNVTQKGEYMSITPSKRTIKARETKQSILEAAMQLFSEYDFDTVTVDDICRKSGSAKGSFYYNFKSKEDLVIIAFIKRMDKYMAAHYVLDDSRPLNEQFQDFIGCMFHYALHVGKDYTRRSYIGQISTQVELMISGRCMVETAFHLIRRGMREEALLHDYTLEEYYTVLIGTFTGLLVKWCTSAHTDFNWEQMMRNQALSFLK